MKKLIIILFPLFVFTLTIFTTIHSLSDLRIHMFHIATLGILSLLFILYVIKDTIKIKNYATVLTVLLLITFCTVRIFSCHLITSSPQNIAHANIINDPCCSAMTPAVAIISITPISKRIRTVEQKPFLSLVTPYISSLTNKSPPVASA